MTEVPIDALNILFPMLSVFVFVLGACIGSFLNVCIYRIPMELSVVKPRSHCPGCKKMISWYDNIPLVSWVALGAKCRNCKTPIASRYFRVELLTAVLFLLVWLKLDMGAGSQLLWLVPIENILIIPVLWLVVSGLILGTFVDFDHMIIPDRVTLGGIVLGLLFSTLIPGMHGQESHAFGFMWSLIGAVSGVGLLWAIAVLGTMAFKKEAMGMGDVKLLGAIGAFFGWGSVIFCVMASSLFGSIAGIAMVIGKKKEMQSRIPFGPYIALAAVVWILWGTAMWNWYTEFFTPPATSMEQYVTPAVQE